MLTKQRCALFVMMNLSIGSRSSAFSRSMDKSCLRLLPTMKTFDPVNTRLLHGICRPRFPLFGCMLSLNNPTYSGTTPAKFLHNVRLMSNTKEDITQQSDKDISYYNAAIDRFFSKGDIRGVKRIYEELKEARMQVSPNSSTMVSLVTAHSHYGDLCLCEEILLYMADAGLSPCEPTLRCLLKAYSTKGDPRSTEVTFSALQSLDYTISVADFNIVHNAYAKKGDLLGCRNSIEKMKSLGLQADITTMNSLIEAYTRAGDPSGAEDILLNMERNGISPNDGSYNIVINAWCTGKTQQPEKGEELLKKSISSGVKPPKSSRNIVINGYMATSNYASAERCIQDMYNSGITPDKLTLDVLIAAYSKDKDAVSTQRVIDYMRTVGLVPTAPNMNSLVLAYANAADTEGADKTIELMKSLGFEINKYALISRLKAYALLGDPIATRRVFDEIVSDGLELTVVAVNVLLSSHRKPSGNSDWDGLMECWEEFFVSGRFVADEYTYNHFLLACKNSNRKDDSELWFSRLLTIEPEPSKYSINLFRQTVQQDRFLRYCSYQSPAIKKNLNPKSTHSLEREYAAKNPPRTSGKRWSKNDGYEPPL